MARRPKKPRVEAMTDQEIHTARMVEQFCGGGRVLDFPCGNGYLSKHLLDKGYDVASADVAKGIFRFPGMSWKQADLDGVFPFDDNTFDAARCVAGLEHTENPYHTLREFRRVLKPGGWLFVQYPNFSSFLRRLRFLTSGRLTRHSPGLILDDEPKGDRGHIACLSLEHVKNILATVNCDLVHTHFFRYRRKTAFWNAPLVTVVRLFAALNGKRRREENLSDALDRDVLFGAEVVLIARRS